MRIPFIPRPSTRFYLINLLLVLILLSPHLITNSLLHHVLVSEPAFVILNIPVGVMVVVLHQHINKFEVVKDESHVQRRQSFRSTSVQSSSFKYNKCSKLIEFIFYADMEWSIAVLIKTVDVSSSNIEFSFLQCFDIVVVGTPEDEFLLNAQVQFGVSLKPLLPLNQFNSFEFRLGHSIQIFQSQRLVLSSNNKSSNIFLDNHCSSIESVKIYLSILVNGG